MSMVAVFHKISSVLCGETDLSTALAADYYALLITDDTVELFLRSCEPLIDNWKGNQEFEMEQFLVRYKEFYPAAKQIINTWYFGRTPGMKEMRSAEHYYHYEALIWKTIHAHPPGLSGGYFGHWAYQPEL